MTRDRRTHGSVGPRALIVAALILVGCSSSDGTNVSTTAPTTTATTTTTTPPTTTPATEPTSDTTDTIDSLAAADVSEITAAFTTFFGGASSTLEAKIAALENGETYRESLTDASLNQQFQQMTTEIRSVVAGGQQQCTALGAATGCAIVTHDLLIAGFPMAVGIDNPAVRIDGRWLVASAAWCHVIEIGGAVCPEAPAS